MAQGLHDRDPEVRAVAATALSGRQGPARVWVDALRKDDYRIQTLILELVKSQPFRMRRGTEGDNP